MNIPLNRPFLPSKKEFDIYTDDIFKRNWLTNHGPLVQQFEKSVGGFLGLEDFIFMNNGTTALLIALKALEVSGEVITTPYSYVATTGSILWQNCSPKFADIDPKTLTVDPELVEDAITDKTTAILATHVYGNPCDVESIDRIAKRYKLKVIYDAAHCFGVTYKGESILKWGDASIISFHATKLFHTIEGGGFFSNQNSLMQKARFMMNFGHDGLYDYNGVGINGKNSEFHAAMGLCNLPHAAQILEKRKMQVEQYKNELQSGNVRFQAIRASTRTNYSYFPVIFNSAKASKMVEEHLGKSGVQTRRYFKPSLDKLNNINTPDQHTIASEISEKVLCLPLFYDLTSKEISYVCKEIIEALEKQ
jgi:dTDP-4-amino-4,6-dideoxygalactose transaminase